MRLSIRVVVTVAFAVLLCPAAWAGGLPFIDAHSQMAKGLDPEKIIPLMDEAGVRVTLLSARNDRRPTDVLALAEKYPDRIVPMVRTKGKPFNTNTPDYYSFMEKQLGNPAFKGMAEVLLYHAQKGNKAPEIAVYPDEPQAAFAFDASLERGWPIIAHIEFASARGKRAEFMKRLKTLLAANPDHPVLLIHMGQLDADDVGMLLAKYRNLHFMTSHSNPLALKEGRQPWTNMFKGKQLAPRWRELILEYPDRFVLAFDNVWPNHWGEFYLKQAKLWRKNLEALPPDVGHAVAHGNAERLWNLPPVK